MLIKVWELGTDTNMLKINKQNNRQENNNADVGRNDDYEDTNTSS